MQGAAGQGLGETGASEPYVSLATGAKPQTPGASQPPGHASYQSSTGQQDRDVLPLEPDPVPISDMASDPDQAWCGWHPDHGSLTGLTAAMYWQATQQPSGHTPLIPTVSLSTCTAFVQQTGARTTITPAGKPRGS